MGTRIVIMAGGTGGHVYPALAVAEELLARGCAVTWMGTPRGLEARVVPGAGLTLDTLTVAGLRGKGWRERITGPFLLLLACVQAFRILRRRRPQVVLGFGGFVSGPGGLVSRLMNIPLVIHEQNCIPGTTNRWLAKLARRVLEAFPDSFPVEIGAECTGNPLRRAMVDWPLREPAQDGRPLRIPEAMSNLNPACEIRHQTGAAMCEQTAATYRRLGIEAQAVAFIEDMAAAYQWADLAVCRAGAMTVSELAAVGLPAILVPYPYAIDDHQTANARYFVTGGAGVCIAQDQLTADALAAQLNGLTADRGQLALMGRRARTLARTDAAERVADVCLAEARP
jgi:UDP-N-acetylglucosamine--N-acetylmuramyl-(pentapeptide) pyrophosphoryl-undecaprenol N-acetylglucosamine transferase